MPERPGPAPRGWREIASDLARPSRQQLVVGAVLALCGLAVTVQLAGSPEQRYSTLRQDDLVAILDDVTDETQRLEQEIAQLESTRRQLESGADASAVAAAESERRLEALELLGGTVAARGPGIRVTISDPEQRVTAEIMLNAIEELRDAGAEVLELNDRVRLVASSWIASRDAGLVADGVALTPPYRLEAIGDARTLAEATRFRGGLVSTIEGERVGGRAQVVEVAELDIDSLHTPVPPRHARPA